MIRMKNYWIIALFTIILINGCYYNIEEELYPTVDCEIIDMSYQNDIAPIMEKDCYACHSIEANFANITVEGYENISIYVSNQKLLNSIKHQAGFSPMPKGTPKLLDCEIEKIEAWILQGAKNN